MRIDIDEVKLAEVIEQAPAEVKQQAQHAVDFNLRTIHTFETAMDEMSKRALLDSANELQRNEDGSSRISEHTRRAYNLAFISMHSSLRAKEQPIKVSIVMSDEQMKRREQTQREVMQRAQGGRHIEAKPSAD